MGGKWGGSSTACKCIRGEVVGWYLPISVMDEEALTTAGVRVVVQMRRVAVGRSARACTQAVGIRSRKEWCRHTISRKGLVGTTGRLAHVDGQEEVLVVGQEVCGGGLARQWRTLTGGRGRRTHGRRRRRQC